MLQPTPFVNGWSMDSCHQLLLLASQLLCEPTTLLQTLVNMASQPVGKLMTDEMCNRILHIVELWAWHDSLTSKTNVPLVHSLDRQLAVIQAARPNAHAKRLASTLQYRQVAERCLLDIVRPLSELELLARSTPAGGQAFHRNRRLLIDKARSLLFKILHGWTWAARQNISSFDLFTDVQNSKHAQSLQAAIDLHSYVSRWIAAEILALHTPAERARAFGIAVHLAERASTEMNLELALTIVRGLLHPSILRLTLTFKEVPSATLKSFQALTSRFFPNGTAKPAPLAPSYPSGTLPPLLPLIHHMNRIYLQQISDRTDFLSQLQAQEQLALAIDTYHTPIRTLSGATEFQPTLQDLYNELLDDNATVVCRIILSYGLEGSDHTLGERSAVVESGFAANVLQFVPQLPQRSLSFRNPYFELAAILSQPCASTFRLHAPPSSEDEIATAVLSWCGKDTLSRKHDIQAAVFAWSRHES